jgi:hypothetical protein
MSGCGTAAFVTNVLRPVLVGGGAICGADSLVAMIPKIGPKAGCVGGATRSSERRQTMKLRLEGGRNG